jgi:CheY-like chemotaxis protein
MADKSQRMQRTVLCIEDKAELLAMERRLLEPFGYVVLSAMTGEAGLALVATKAVDAVILDYDLPDVDGGIVAQRIREVAPHVPIILYSGMVDQVPKSTLDSVQAVVSKGEPATRLIAVLGDIVGAQPVTSTDLRGQGHYDRQKRRFPRYKFETGVTIGVLRENIPVYVEGSSIDLAEGGAGVRITEPLQVEEIVDLQIPLHRRSLRLPAAVRYRRGDEYGFEFLAVDPQEREFIRTACSSLPQVG